MRLDEMDIYLNDEDIAAVKRPVREDFCWFIPSGAKRFDTVPFRTTGIDLSKCRVTVIPHWNNAFHLFDNGEGVFKGDMLVCESVPKEEREEALGVFIFQEDGFKKALNEWKQYWDWMKVRNEARWQIQERGLDYDCYSEDTLFLTENGWKSFDSISEGEKLATIDGSHNLIFETPTERIDKKYTGKMVTFNSRYVNFKITENHHILVNDCHRTRYNGFSRKLTENNWYLERFSDYWSGKRSNKHFLCSVKNPRKDNQKFSDEFLKLCGFYLSEGSVCYDKKGKPSAVFFSQKEGGKVCDEIESITEYRIKKTVCFREHIKANEFTYRIQDKTIASRFESDFGHGCENKKLPKWVMSLSTRQFWVLFNAMMLGDGHRHSKGHSVYYSKSIRLINDLQLLFFKNRITTQVYDYSPKNQVSHLLIPKNNKEYITITKQSRSNNKTWDIEEVQNKRVVCFSMKSGILITKRNNKIAIQGNCKNMLHTLRTLMIAENIITKGEPIVRFQGEDLAFLRKIREGVFTFEELLTRAEDIMAKVDRLRETCDLPPTVNHKAVNKLFKELAK